jgi:hypothetical protein
MSVSMNCSRHAIETYTIQHFWNRHIMHRDHTHACRGSGASYIGQNPLPKEYTLVHLHA